MIFKEMSVGMEVVANSKAHPELVGKRGTIKVIVEDVAGVEMEEMLYLHDCEGCVKQGHGWYFQPNEIDEECNSNLCRLMERDKDLIKKVRSKETVTINDKQYTIRENGKFLFVERSGNKVIVVSRTLPTPAFWECNCEEDRKIINHVVDMFKILVGQALTLTTDGYAFVAYTEGEEKEVEKVLFQKPETFSKVKGEIEKPVTTTVQTEEELYAMLGIDVVRED